MCSVRKRINAQESRLSLGGTVSIRLDTSVQRQIGANVCMVPGRMVTGDPIIQTRDDQSCWSCMQWASVKTLWVVEALPILTYSMYRLEPQGQSPSQLHSVHYESCS